MGSPSFASASLPKRWSLKQRCKNTLIYYGILALTWLWQRIPRSSFKMVSYTLGRLIYWATPKLRKLAKKQLQRSISHFSPPQSQLIIKDMFSHLVYSSLEIAQQQLFLEDPQAIVFDEQSRKLYRQALYLQRGLIVLSAHVGNWELLAQKACSEGYPITTVAKPLYDPRLTQWAHQQRTSNGLKILWRGEKNITQRMRETLENNQVLCVLVDQDTKVEGDFVPFFGQPALTPSFAIQLALWRQCPILLTLMIRQKNRHHIYTENIWWPKPLSQTTTLPTSQSLLHCVNQHLEHTIRQHPEQWIWIHERWRSQPPHLTTS